MCATPPSWSTSLPLFPSIVGIGTCTQDILGLVPHLPKLDQGAPLLDYTVQGGGPVATAMVASARLGVPSGFIGQVGDDDIG
ncbi:MAG: hypothetical protein QGH20_06545, partial [Candidatus Latescibacteria bacterium]|nr:hypothetical protein [Candidatus Latescibacterota bacterium]